MEKVELSLTVINNVLAYLQERPFKESASLINSIVSDIQTNKAIDETTPSEEKQLLTEDTK